MMLYTFESEDGQTLDLPFSATEVPKIGEIVHVDGKPYRRVFCGHIGQGTIAQHSKYPYLSTRLNPAEVKGARIVKWSGSGKKKILIESAKHEKEVMAKNDLVKEG